MMKTNKFRDLFIRTDTNKIRIKMPHTYPGSVVKLFEVVLRDAAWVRSPVEKEFSASI